MSALLCRYPATSTPDGVVFTLPIEQVRLRVACQAAYRFTGTHYVAVDMPDADKLTVSFQRRDGQAEFGEELENRFAAELADTAVREELEAQTRMVRQLLLGRSLFTTIGGKGAQLGSGMAVMAEQSAAEQEELDRLLKELEAEAAADPAAIVTPWDDVYGAPDAAATAPAEESSATSNDPAQPDA